MPIYTKTGDKGETGLFGGARVPKYDDRVETYGSLDELTSFIGLVIAKNPSSDDIAFLTEIQLSIYQIMSILAGYEVPVDKLNAQVDYFEKYIDQTESTLPKLRDFILPQGGEVSSLFQVVRTLTRKSERLLVKLFHKHSISTEEKRLVMLQFLNRLSDLFFVMGRKYENAEEIQVRMGKRREK